jgi:hypothetical protein
MKREIVMGIIGIRDLINEKEEDEKLNDIYMNLSLCVSMASGYVWKEKVNSFSKLIAKELLTFFEEEPLKLKYPTLTNSFYKICFKDSNLCFRKNNLFKNIETLDKKEFLNQKLMYLDKYQLPPFLTNIEKEQISKKITREEYAILNKNYNRQELNGNRYFLIDRVLEKQQLLAILKKASFFSMTIEEYLTVLAQGNKDLKLNVNEEIFNNTCNNYILELGAYVAKRIKENSKR